MHLRRCPSCKNMISRDTPVCPICGIGYVRAIVTRVLAWSVLFLLAAFWIGRRLLER